MVVEGHFVDVAGAPAVVVDDRHLLTALQQRLRLHALGAVGVHHHQEGGGLGVEEGGVAGDKGAAVLRLLLEPAEDGMDGVILGVDDDLGLFAPLAGDGHDAGGGAQAVHVGVLVAHDVHVARLVHQLAQSIGHNTGLHLGALLGGLGAAAVELKVAAILHHGLVAAPAEGHLQGHGGVLEQGLVALAVPAHANRQRGGHVAALDGVDLLHHVEILLGKGGVVLLLKDEQIPVAVIAQQQSAGLAPPLGQLFLQLGDEGGALGLGAGLDQLLIVVHHDDGHHGTGHVQGVAHLLGVGDILPVGGGHRVGAAHLLAAADAAEHPERPVVPLHQLRALPLALNEPVGGKIGHHVGDGGLKKAVGALGQVLEQVVGPQHLTGGHVEDHHGQGGIQQAAGPGGVQAAGDAVHVLADVGLGLAVAPHAHVDHHRRHRQLHQAQDQVEGNGGQGEGHQHHRRQGHVGSDAVDELIIHLTAPFATAYRPSFQSYPIIP